MYLQKNLRSPSSVICFNTILFISILALTPASQRAMFIIVPLARTLFIAASTVDCNPAASKATSTPTLDVVSKTASVMSHMVGSMTTVAPCRAAKSRRRAAGSATIIFASGSIERSTLRTKKPIYERVTRLANSEV